jgi:predicted nucleotidyltransferase
MYLSEPDKQKIIEICQRNDIFYCAVFGSFARGEATAESDVDLLVKFSKRIGLFGFVGVQLEMEEALNRKVDLATEGCLSKYIRDSVMRDLRLIYENAEQSRPSPAYTLTRLPKSKSMCAATTKRSFSPTTKRRTQSFANYKISARRRKI